MLCNHDTVAQRVSCNLATFYYHCKIFQLQFAMVSPPRVSISVSDAYFFTCNNPITRQQVLDSSKLKEFAEDNFKFDENGRKLSKWVENTVGKGEIARYKQFLLFPQCFQKVCFPGASKGVIVWEWVISLRSKSKSIGRTNILSPLVVRQL